MLQWFRKQQIGTSKLNGNGSDEHLALMRKLVDYLEGQISSPKKATSVLSQIARFKELPPTYQEKELPRIYLSVENYLCEEDPLQKFTKSQLRKTVKYRFEALMEFEDFSIIFEDKTVQALSLCQAFLKDLISKVATLVHNSDEAEIKKAAEWINNVPEIVQLEMPFGITDKIPEDAEAWNSTLKKVSDAIYAYLLKKVGEEGAATQFEKSFQEIADTFRELESFHFIVEMLPDHILDESKIGLLSADQIRSVFLKKLANLQHTNESLAVKNYELKETQGDLEAAQETALESVKLFHSVLNTIDEGIIAADAAGKIILVNRQALDMFGYEEEELAGKDFTVLLPEKYRDQHRLGEKIVEETGLARAFGENLSVEGLKKDQSVFPVELQFTKTVNSGQTFFTVAVRDVSQDMRHKSEYKKALKNLRVAKDQFRTLFDAMPDTIFKLSLDGNFVLLNPAFETVTGWDKDEWVEKPFTQIVHPDDSMDALKAFQRVLQEEEARLPALRIRNSADEFLIGKFALIPQMQNGKMVGVLGFAHNMTPEHTAEKEAVTANPGVQNDAVDADTHVDFASADAAAIDEQKEVVQSLEKALHEKEETLENTESLLRQSDDRYYKLLEFGESGMGIHTNGRLALINKTGARILGATSPEDIMDKHMLDFIHGDDRERFQELIFKMIKDGDSTTPTGIKMLRVDGSVVEVEYRAIPVPYNNSQAIQFTFREQPVFELIDEEVPETNGENMLLRQAFDATPDGVIVSNLDGAILAVNPAVCNLLNMKRDALMGTDYLLRVPEDLREEVSQNVYLLIHNRINECNVVFEKDDGAAVPVRLRAKRLNHDENSLILLFLRKADADAQAETESLASLQQHADEVTGLENQLREAHEQRDLLESRVEELQQRFENTQTAGAAVKTDSDSVQARLQEAEEQASAKEQALTEAQQKASELAEELQSKQTQIEKIESEWQEKIQQSEANVAELQQQLQTKADAVEKLENEQRQQLQTKADAVEKLENELRESLRQNEELEARFQENVLDFNDAQATVEQSLAARESGEQQLKDLQQLLEETQKQHSESKQQAETANQQLAEMKQASEETRAVREAGEQQLKDLQQLLEETQQQLLESKQQAETANQQLAEMKQASEETRQAFETAKAHAEALENRLESMQTKYDEANEKFAEISEVLKVKQESDRKLQERYSVVQAKLRNAEKRLEEVQTRHDEMLTRWEKMTREYEDMRSKTDTAQALHDNLQVRITSGREERDEVEQKLAESRAEHEAAKNKLAAMSVEVEEKNSVVEAVREELAKATEKLKDVKSQFETVSRLREETEADHAGKITALQEAETVLSELQARIAETQSEHSAIAAKLTETRGTFESATVQLSNLQAEVDDKTDTLNTLKEDLEDTTETLESLKKQRDESYVSLANLRQEHDEATQKSQEAKAQLGALQSELAKTKAEYETIFKQLAAAKKGLKETTEKQAQIESSFNKRHGSMQALEARCETLKAQIADEKIKVRKLSSLFPITSDKQVRDDEEYWEKVWKFADDPDNKEFFA